MVGKVLLVLIASDTQDANMELVMNPGNVTAKKAGVAFSATRIWIIAPTTDLAETELHATTPDKENTLVRVNPDGKDKIVKSESQTNANISHVLMVELVR